MDIVSRPSMHGQIIPGCSTRPRASPFCDSSLPRVGPDLWCSEAAVEGIDVQGTKASPKSTSFPVVSLGSGAVIAPRGTKIAMAPSERNSGVVSINKRQPQAVVHNGRVHTVPGDAQAFSPVFCWVLHIFHKRWFRFA